MAEDRQLAISPLKTPRAAALAGIAFSILLIAALVLLRISTLLMAGRRIPPGGAETSAAL
jgi:hypothetical protein